VLGVNGGRQNNPNMLYRYLRKEHAVQAIESGLFKVGRLAELNDPFEFIPAIDGAPPNARDSLERFFIEMFNDSIGILCFSNVVTDPVVWSHYAEGHGGIALGFDYPALDALVAKGEFIRVTYSDSRPTINHREFAEGQTARNLAVAKSVLGTKATSWECEREYRLFIPLHDGKVIARNGMYWHPIPKHLLVEVVPGIRCPIDDGYLRKALKDGGFTRAVVKRAIRSRTDFAVKLSTTDDIAVVVSALNG
jgi:hypothetical protein